MTRLNTLVRIGGGDCCPGYRREILQEASSPGFDYLGNLILEIKVMAQVVRKEFPTGMKADHFFVQVLSGLGVEAGLYSYSILPTVPLRF